MLAKLLSLLFGGAGVGSAVANVGKFVALAPVVLWLLENKDATAVSLTYGQLALCGLVVFAVVQAAHVARGPGSSWAGPGPGDWK